MSEGSRKKAVIIGSGALGLGYLTERMSRDYDICLVDVGMKAQELKRIGEEQGFMDNLCHLDHIEFRTVTGNFETAIIDSPADSDRLADRLRNADLVLTVTGRKLLDTLVPNIAPMLNASSKRRWLLFCENGLNIAETFEPQFREEITTVDTVMSRMCRFAGSEETAYKLEYPGSKVSLVVESYSMLPLDRTRCQGGPFTDVFNLVSKEEFLCWEDVKLYMHNGMHAWVAAHAFLEGARMFPDTPKHIRDQAEEVMLTEVVPAVHRTHPTIDGDFLVQYGLELLARFYNPYFNDDLERGTRGMEQKLAPGERIMGGIDFIRKAGIEPKGFESAIAAGRKIIELGAAPPAAGEPGAARA